MTERTMGLMQNQNLLISDLLTHAEQSHADQTISSRRVEGDIHHYSFKECADRTKQLANALTAAGINRGDRIATIAWNNYRHLELYFAVSGLGAIVHTINPRLFAEQLIYILNHAEDKFIFVDATFVPLVEAVRDQVPTIEKIFVLVDEDHMPTASIELECYESFIASQSKNITWPRFDENTASSLCYTSGTTGNPKGVLYSHRSTLLHAYAAISPEGLNMGSFNTALPVVPMFHVNAWGIPYCAMMSGIKLVLPGPGLDGAMLTELIDLEKPDILLGVPTVWLNLLNYQRAHGKTLSSVDTVVIGGSAAPRSMIEAFDKEHNAFVMHAWGMTEMSPLGTANTLNRTMRALSKEAQYSLQEKQGKPVFGVFLDIVDDENKSLARDGKTYGRLLVRGPWIIRGYYKSDDQSSFIERDDGTWFDTGDVATLDHQNYMQIVDRSKDVIKSGGEWISSIDLENAAMSHESVMEACVIGVPHAKWDERPLMLVIRTPGNESSKDHLLNHLERYVAKWWLPDDIVYVEELPHGATGKLLKNVLRDKYQKHLL